MPQDTGFVEVAGITDIPDGTMKKVVLSGNPVLLARVGGRIYATDALCPHLQADLSEGTLRGTLLTCPLHGSVFDVTTGHVIRWTDLKGTILSHAAKTLPPRPLRTYPVRIVGDRVLVSLA